MRTGAARSVRPWPRHPRLRSGANRHFRCCGLRAQELACVADGAELLRLGENAIYRLADHETVVRIARNMDHWADAEKEVAVSRWLHQAGVPAARACDLRAAHQRRRPPNDVLAVHPRPPRRAR